MSDGVSRRDLLRGRLRAPSPEVPETTRTPPQRSSGTLPRVIAWLDESSPTPPPRPTGAGSRRAPLVRPPGAIEEEAFLASCTRCGECERACPHGAIRPAPAHCGEARNTPWIDVLRAPCMMCEDFPCIRACESGALDLAGAGPIGTAFVRELDCLNRLGSPCSVCVEHCPVPDAIVLRGSTPVVEPALCTGCGRCAHPCPAPEKAILLLPRARRAVPHSRSEASPRA